MGTPDQGATVTTDALNRAVDGLADAIAVYVRELVAAQAPTPPVPDPEPQPDEPTPEPQPEPEPEPQPEPVEPDPVPDEPATPDPEPEPPVVEPNLPIDIPNQPPVRRLKRTPPPPLTVPVVKRVTNSDRTVSLKAGVDYIIDMPEKIMGRLDFNGGRSIQVIGGEVSVTSAAARAMYFNDQTGTVYAEGLHLGAQDGQVLKEGFNIDHRGPGVYLVNNTTDVVQGTYAGHHADVVQCWGMPTDGVLEIDGLDCGTSYQFLMWQPQQFSATQGTTGHKVRMRNVLVRRTTKAGYTIYNASRDTTSWDIEDFFVIPSEEGHGGNTYYGKPHPEGITVLPFDATPESPILGTPGLGYVSPGYAA